MAIAVQETAARLGLVTGRGLASLIRARFPKPVLYLALALTLTANTFNISADVAAMAAASRLVVDVPVELLAVAITALMLALELTLPYHRYARVLRWLALSLLACLIVLVMVDVDWDAVASSLVAPSLSFDRAEIAALIAVFGTTVSPYLFFWQASEEVEEELEHPDPAPSVRAQHLTAMRVDVVGGMVPAVAVAFVIMVVAASTLHTGGITTVATADEAARALEPLAGDLAGLVFAIGIVGLGLLAVPVLAGSTAFALSETLAWHEGLSGRIREDRGFYAVLTASMLGGVVIGLLLDPIRSLYFAAILNGLAAPPLIVLMLLLARDPAVCGPHTSRRLATSALTVTIVVSVSLPILYLVGR